jgi:hypothetical protein
MDEFGLQIVNALLGFLARPEVTQKPDELATVRRGGFADG